MRTWMVLAMLTVTACSKKTAPAAAEPEPEPAAAPAPEPEPEPEPEVEGASAERPGDTEGAGAERPPTAKDPNADFTAALTFADGTNTKGHVVRVERSEDWYAEDGWTGKPMKTTVTLSGDGTEVEKEWKDIRSVSVTYGDKGDIQCQFDSAYTPVMYMCVLKTTTRVTDADGKTWDAATRHKWRFVFEGGETEDFWIWKLPARQQEQEVPELGETSENTDMYIGLQKQLMTDKNGKVVTSIKITPPS